MNRKLRTVQIGYGKMGHCIVENMTESGANVVAIFDQGKAGEVCDITGRTIEGIDNLEARLEELSPDCAVVATRSLMRDVEETLTVCAKHGINVVTTCDEALYPWISSPAISKRLDKLAKKNNCTIIGSGFPDLSYCYLVASTCGAAHRIKSINGVASYNVDDYGIALAEHHGVGLSKEEFEKTIGRLNNITEEEQDELIENCEFTAIPMFNANCWLAAKLGLTITRIRQFNTPIILDHDITSSTMGRVIKAGETIGMSAKSIAWTNEGITIETESIGKVYEEGEEDVNDWVIKGEPDIYVGNCDINNQGMICALIVSRIVDAMNGPAGLVTTNKLPTPVYLAKRINHYVREN